MSLQMSIKSLTSPLGLISKSALSTSRTSTQAYLRQRSILRRLYYAQHSQPRRYLSATEYQPQSLDPAPPPPRNTNIPDSSIAGASPEIRNTRPPRQTDQHEILQPKSSTTKRETQLTGITESEAQKSQPVVKPKSEDKIETKTKPERRSRLRSRKAALTLTPSATTQLQSLLNLPEPKYIRVGVKNRGCSGLAYHLEYVDRAAPFDEAVEQDGVKVLIDSKALFSIIGSEMDWVEDKLNQRFVFRNPNIKEQCGCGESFMV